MRPSHVDLSGLGQCVGFGRCGHAAGWSKHLQAPLAAGSDGGAGREWTGGAVLSWEQSRGYPHGGVYVILERWLRDTKALVSVAAVAILRPPQD